jgi:MFS superfamily sulfate permease-like transporter
MGTYPGIRVVLLDLNMSSSIDVTACDGLKRFIVETNKIGIKVWFVGVHTPVRNVLDNAGISELVGDHFYLEINEAVDHYQSEHETAQEMNVTEQDKKEPPSNETTV